MPSLSSKAALRNESRLICVLCHFTGQRSHWLTPSRDWAVISAQREMMLLVEVKAVMHPFAGGWRTGHLSWSEDKQPQWFNIDSIKVLHFSGKLSWLAGQLNYLCLHPVCSVLLKSNTKWVSFETAALVIDSAAPCNEILSSHLMHYQWAITIVSNADKA